MSPNKKILKIILREFEDIETAFMRFNCYDYAGFEKDPHLKKIAVMSLINVSEVALSLPLSFRKKHSGVNWQQFKTLRNIGAHKYGAVNFTIVWNILQKDAPVFKTQIQNLHECIE
jgi:uncharacterized protein with HEPN domain